MAKKNSRNTKGRIISAAWELFYEQGYDDTTIEEIIEKSQTSKGSFYHYFEGKDALLTSLSILFDEKYEELMETIDKDMDSFDKLMYLNRELFKMVENRISLDLLARLYSSQLVTKGEKHLLDHNRVYFKVLRQTVIEGQQRGQLVDDISVNEIVKVYAMCERALLYDWCICNGDYSLVQYSSKTLPMLMGGYRKTHKEDK
ncbi:MAG: TetR/AcrR family transcriptional regulator [Clostridia bacterium]|nr:TetR/AcrR family transcriptional regulator [Clostridia bacterium]